MVVTATYSDDSTAAVSNYTTSGFDSSAPAESQTVTVSYSEGGVTRTASFTVTIRRPGTSVTLYWVNEQGQLVFANGGAASITGAGSVAIEPQNNGWAGQRWYVNGAEDIAQAGQASYTFSGAGKTAGRYAVGLLAKKDGVYYYAECVVTVAN
jgi:flagellar hook assembly protein FlgD